MTYSIAMLLVLAIGAAAAAPARANDGGWRSGGRATFYGLDGWSIHQGSCGMGYQWPDIAPGWDVAALSDASGEFAGSCGACYEVRCAPEALTDGYGARADRTGACRDAAASVVVKVVDACPCRYAGNAYSNARWCCGDSGRTHFDLSVWAFEKLADKSNGVIGLQFRKVDCGARPAKPATTASPSPGEYASPPAWAVRPEHAVFVKRYDALGAAQGSGVLKAGGDAAGVDGADVIPTERFFPGVGSAAASPSSPSAAQAAETCDDKAPSSGKACADVKARAKCGDGWLRKEGACRETCGLCARKGAAQHAPAAEPAAAAPAAPPPEPSQTSSSSSSSSSSCADAGVPASVSYEPSCDKQKEWGACADATVSVHCRKTCGLCGQVQAFSGRRLLAGAH